MITILLSTYNGEKYLKELLDSLSSQTYKDFNIIARDDGSTDKTLDILKEYNIKVIDSSKNIGVKGSFSTLMEYALKNSKSKYFMLCDQDDVWFKDKLEIVLKKIQEEEKVSPELPILVHTDLKVVDEDLKIISNSFFEYEKIDPKYNSLNRLLLHNVITGCSVIFNKKLLELSIPILDESIMHDWWIGLVASSFGKVVYIKKTTLLYRQHGKNTMGAKGFSYIEYAKKIFEPKVGINKHIKQASSFLNTYKNDLKKDKLLILEDFVNIKNFSFFKKRWILYSHKIYKQGFFRKVGLFLTI